MPSAATLEAASKLGYDPEDLDYPSPFIIPPTLAHKQSFIILHGRGDTARHFSWGLMTHAIDGQNIDSPDLHKLYPHARFIFPTASKRVYSRFKGTVMPQWFDIYSIWQQREQEENQFEGLRESTEFIHNLVRTEVDAVGAENVVLWGLSQGCAASLTAMLLWPGEKLAACIGMCGWLPLRERMGEHLHIAPAIRQPNTGQEDGAQGRGTDLSLATDPKEETVKYLQDLIELPGAPGKSSMAFQQVPFFLGHGTEDPQVPLDLAVEAKEFLPELGVNTLELRQYGGLAHWYSSEMLMDIVTFLKNKAGIVPGDISE